MKEPRVKHDAPIVLVGDSPGCWVRSRAGVGEIERAFDSVAIDLSNSPCGSFGELRASGLCLHPVGQLQWVDDEPTTVGIS